MIRYLQRGRLPAPDEGFFASRKTLFVLSTLVWCSNLAVDDSDAALQLRFSPVSGFTLDPPDPEMSKKPYQHILELYF